MSDNLAADWEAKFYGVELPETAQIDSGVFISDVQGFLKKSFAILKAGNVRVSEPVEWRLQKLLDIVNETNGTKE